MYKCGLSEKYVYILTLLAKWYQPPFWNLLYCHDGLKIVGPCLALV